MHDQYLRGGYQSTRTRGHGPDGAYCKLHDPEAVALRQKVTRPREDARYRTMRLAWAGPRFFEVLKQIADGHNDPRALAAEALASLLPLPGGGK
ncbi:hypothetical protein CWC26_21705 [Pseudoalteromonas sp. S4488]|nr:hypothetical protein CWC26_21705 [Pseudoalteromonas sp. S4488]